MKNHKLPGQAEEVVGLVDFVWREQSGSLKELGSQAKIDHGLTDTNGISFHRKQMMQKQM